MKYLSLFLLFLFNCNLFSQPSDPDLFEIKDFSYLRDTVYTLHPYFIEVNLATQMGYLHSKTDSVFEFGVSTGSKKLKDGVDTKEGLFVIQSMMPKWHSRQFDSTLMLNWMGFNYGIGFHALAGKSYYKYLGKKKSSHGCVRISRENAADIYSKINLGTPVLVHSDNNAVWISFLDSTDQYNTYTSDRLIDIMKDRYKNIYSGNYFTNKHEMIVIDYGNVNHPGLPIGERRLIPKRQVVKPFHLFLLHYIPPVRGAVKIDRAIKRDLTIKQLFDLPQLSDDIILR